MDSVLENQPAKSKRECSNDYPPEQVQPRARVHFFGAGAETRHHCFLCVLSGDRRYCRFLGAKRGGEASASCKMAPDASCPSPGRAGSCSRRERVDRQVLVADRNAGGNHCRCRNGPEHATISHLRRAQNLLLSSRECSRVGKHRDFWLSEPAL